jgi:class 3 adenylate cyclase
MTPTIVPWALVVTASVLAATFWMKQRRARQHARTLRTRLHAASQELQRLQLSFARFAPREVVERVVASGVPTTGEKREITVLFADLVGFSTFSERLDPVVVVRMLNGYFTCMSRAITDHRGHVAKFIGDGLLALFGALDQNPWQANDAVHAALAMSAALEEYNQSLAAEGLPRLRFGVGIHCGPVVAGILGSDELIEFTAIGRNVNLAARVEALTRIHQVSILVTPEVKDALDPRFVLRALPAAPVKGFAAPVVTYAVEGYAG